MEDSSRLLKMQAVHDNNCEANIGKAQEQRHIKANPTDMKRDELTLKKKNKIRTTRPGGSANYHPKCRKGACQYIMRLAHGSRKRGEECGRLGKLREDGSCKCLYHFRRAENLLKARMKNARASLQSLATRERIKETVQLFTEELYSFERARTANT